MRCPCCVLCCVLLLPQTRSSCWCAVTHCLRVSAGVKEVRLPANRWRHLVLDIGVHATPHPKYTTSRCAVLCCAVLCAVRCAVLCCPAHGAQEASLGGFLLCGVWGLRRCGQCICGCECVSALYGPQERVSYVGIADGVGSWAEVLAT